MKVSLSLDQEELWYYYEYVLQMSMSVQLAVTTVMPMLCVLTLLGILFAHVSLVMLEME